MGRIDSAVKEFGDNGMSEISELLYQSYKSFFQSIIEKKCSEYQNNNKYKIQEFRKDGRLIGLMIYHEELDCIYVDEVHNDGEDIYIPLKIYKFLRSKHKNIRGTIQKWNTKLIKLYNKLGFVVLRDNENNLLMQRGI